MTTTQQTPTKITPKRFSIIGMSNPMMLCPINLSADFSNSRPDSNW